MLAAAMTTAQTWGNTQEQIYDRSYRLRYNKGQVLMDKVSARNSRECLSVCVSLCLSEASSKMSQIKKWMCRQM